MTCGDGQASQHGTLHDRVRCRGGDHDSSRHVQRLHIDRLVKKSSIKRVLCLCATYIGNGPGWQVLLEPGQLVGSLHD